MKKFGWFFLLMVLAIACRKDAEETTIITTEYDPPVIRVTGTILGRVIAEDGSPVAGASVKLGNQEVLSGDQGYFSFVDKTLNGRGTYIRVEMPGYFHGSTRLFPQPNSTNYTQIRLMAKTLTGTVTAGSGGTVQTPDGASVKLPANGIVTGTGTSYTGEVQVAARWLNPRDPNLGEIMPGGLQGVNTNGREVALGTYGMMAVELQSPAGEALNIATGYQAELSFPVPAALRSSAPAEIPLWYFDETDGIWKEEGKARLVGDRYVGQVAHFSFWNCDVPYPLVMLKGQLLSAGGDTLANTRVCVTVVSEGLTGSGVTDDAGIFSGLVPRDEALLLEVKDPCGTAVYSQEIGPLTEDTDLGAITVDIPALEPTGISGTLLNCDGEPVSNGFVEIAWDGFSTFVNLDTAGTFSLTTLLCGQPGEVSIQGFDVDNLKQSVAQTFPVANPLEAGEITACDTELDEYMVIDVDGTVATYVAPVFNQSGNGIYFSAFGPDSTYSLSIQIWNTPIGVGSYSGSNLNVFYFDQNLFPGQYAYCQACNTITVTIGEYGAPGELITGTFGGTLDFYGNDQNPTTTNVPVSGTFRVKRE